MVLVVEEALPVEVEVALVDVVLPVAEVEEAVELLVVEVEDAVVLVAEAEAVVVEEAVDVEGKLCLKHCQFNV